ncbi:MAG TPA: methyltransferase domain-containing protein [Terriglobia bacterium]|nr:methyltransferase domain-containing protein [Terriglobia bacterium]
MNATRFIREFISQPNVTGAITPSSSFLAKAVIESLNLKTADVVLEYGPGTGVFTDYISRELKPGAKLVAIEVNPKLAAMFKARHPRAVLVEDSVANVRTICDGMGIHSVDCIVSSLPWAAFSESTQVELLDATMTVLKPHGKFVTFAYLHGLTLSPGKRFAELLPRYFRRVSKSSVVWMNIPPAFVYRCTR